MAEVHFVDGQALGPASFGTDSYGVWIPKAYSGSYGTNGFYLDFSNSASLGADSSGNSNNWTLSNLAATDQMLDTPTNNWCTFNPVNGRESSGTYSEGNLKYVGGSDGHGAISSFAITHDCYAEFKFQATGQYGIIGIRNPDNTKRYTWTSTGYLYTESGWTGISTSTYGVGDIIGITVDYDGNIDLYKNNTLVRTLTATSHFAGHDMVFYAGGGNTGATWTANFGQDSSFAGTSTAQSNTDSEGFGEFYYSRASSYLALCAANMAVTDAVDPAQDNFAGRHFNTVLYTGNRLDNSSTNAISGVGFQPDWVWIKNRNEAYSHYLFDGVRGATKYVLSNSADAEETSSVSVTSFDSDGFTLGSQVHLNRSGYTYAAWNWKANGSGVTNTNGSITSTVSANPDAGFSIVTFTGNGSNATVGHGLSKAPECIIVKERNVSGNWHVFHTGLDNMTQQHLRLQSTTSVVNLSSAVAAPTSTTFGVNNALVLSNPNVAYCFHSVEGYSKFGSYVGNGSSDGPFVYLGFRPAFMLVKIATGASEHWAISDSARSPYNQVNLSLVPSLSNSESSLGTNPQDFLSNGWKPRNTYTTYNRNGSTYIYMAFAEQPFKYANAR
jgi:hypothetical protein